MSSVDDSRGRSSSEADEEPATKKQRQLTEADLGGPIEDEESARKKLKEVGFDPDNISALVEDIAPPDGIGQWDVSPMLQFCAAGDLRMVRYLVSRGASTTERLYQENRGDEYQPDTPMLTAARMGQRHICEWLFNHGARADVRSFWSDTTPLEVALRPWKAGRGSDTPEWLVLNGALSHSDGSPNTNAIEDLAYFNGPATGFRQLLDWAKQTLVVNESMRFILLGSISPKGYSDSALLRHLIDDMKTSEVAGFVFDRLSSDDRRELWEMLPSQQRKSSLQMLSGKAGILELVAEFAGYVRGKNLIRILRAVVGPLERALQRARMMKDPGDDDNESDADDEIPFIL